MPEKFYAVKKGKVPGVYLTWKECSAQVTGFSGAVYKKFFTREEAEDFLKAEDILEKPKSLSKESDKISAVQNEKADRETVVAYVDGSFERILGKYAYGCVILFQDTCVELSGSGAEEGYLSMNNVAGELLGSIHAIQWAIAHQAKTVYIYHDYEGIARWANGEWKANKEKTQAYRQFIKESREKIQIIFVKVAAHTGVKYNEQADQLAKKALGIL